MAPSRPGPGPGPGRQFPPPEPDATPAACTLPHDLVLEIVARSDTVTVVRSAATCKPLRRDILSPAFIRRVCSQQHGPNGGGGVVPRFLVGYLKAGGKRAPFSLVHVHPATPAAASFSEAHLAPFLSRRAAADLGTWYWPLASRNGLVVLCRGWWDICVYDPMTGDRATHLPHPPDIGKADRAGYGISYTYVLLTAADGIGCSFLLLATDESVSRIQTASSSDAGGGTCTWGPVINVDKPDCPRRGRFPLYWEPHSCAVILNGLIHWLMCADVDLYILTYAVPRHGTRAETATGSIELPEACLQDGCQESDVHLTTSPDGRLSLLVADRFTISIWLLSGSTACWARQSVIDTEAIVRSVSPHELPQWVDFVRSSAGLRSGAVLLRPFMSLDDEGDKGLLLLDMGTEEMRRVDKKEGCPYEVDMEARLSAMKIFTSLLAVLDNRIIDTKSIIS